MLYIGVFMQAIIGLIRNLALSLENHAALRDNGLISILIQLMNKAYQESSSRQGGPPGYVVRFEWLCLQLGTWYYSYTLNTFRTLLLYTGCLVSSQNKTSYRIFASQLTHKCCNVIMICILCLCVSYGWCT